MKALLSFDTMLTPKIIVIIYFLGLLGVLVTGVLAILSGELLKGVIVIAGGALIVRIYCEIFIIFFKMNEALQELRKK
jgi:hypothetical protein